MADMDVDGVEEFDEWREEEREYLKGLSKEPPQETLEM